MWTHTVLELYPKPLSGNLPEEGDPADWIEEGRVLYCQGDDETVIYFAPLWWILWVKVKKYAEFVHALFYNYVWSKTPWERRRWERFREENPIEEISSEELRERLGDEEYETLKEVVGLDD